MTRYLNSTSSMLGLAASLLIGAAGCSTANQSTAGTSEDGAMQASALSGGSKSMAGIDRSADAVAAVRNLRSALVDEKAQVDKTLIAMSAVTQSQGELVPVFQTYVQSLSDLQAARQKSKAAADDMREKARGYITGWEVEVYGVSDTALREQAERRRNEVRRDYSGITDSLRGVQTAYDTFQTRSEDLRRFLANDLTRAGIEAASTAGNQTSTAGTELKSRIDATLGNLDTVLTHMAPTGPTNNTAARPVAPADSAAEPASGSSVQGVTPRGDEPLNKP